MLRWVDGFEHYGAVAHMTEGVGGGAAWSQVDNNDWNISTANPATGTYHLRLSDTATTPKIVRRIVGTSQQVVGFGYRFSVEDLPSEEDTASNAGTQLSMVDFRDVANGQQCHVSMGTDGSVYACRGDTFLGRSDPCIAPGGYHHFEAKIKVDNTTGYIEVRINEVTVLNLTGIDTQGTASAECSQVAIRMQCSAVDSTVGFGTFDVEDAFLWDDDDSDPENTVVDFVGDKGAYYLRPNADTATSEFDINGSATAYGALDEVPPNGTDYLDTALSTARTIVGVESLPGNVSEVIAMQSVIYTRKEESGTVEMRGGIVSGVEESYGPTDSPSTEYAYIRPAVKTIDPDTGVAWASDAEPELLIERTA